MIGTIPQYPHHSNMNGSEPSDHPQCPSLAHFTHRATTYSTPTNLNTCFAQQKTTRRFKSGPQQSTSCVQVSLDQQKSTCLVRTKWKACPHFLAADQKAEVKARVPRRVLGDSVWRTAHPGRATSLVKTLECTPPPSPLARIYLPPNRSYSLAHDVGGAKQRPSGRTNAQISDMEWLRHA